MKKKFYKDTYLIRSSRLPDRDYGKSGKYFVTICTRGRMQWFGEVKDGVMELNEMGKIVRDEWLKTPNVRPNVEIDAWCVMPNHVHGIIIINRSVETPRRGVSTNSDTHWHSGVLGSIVNQMKGAATKRIRSAGYEDFSWQPRFYDRIIRSDAELRAIRLYICKNADQWDEETIPWHTDAQYWGL